MTLTMTDMENKLEFKYIAPYLSYGLKMGGHSPSYGGMLVRDVTLTNVMSLINGDINMKPILRPLSDLEDGNSEGWINRLSEETNNSLSYCNGHFSDCIVDGFDIKWLPQVCYEWLIANHFDVHNLIPSGLAISYKEAGL